MNQTPDFIAPLRVPKSKKKDFILNINQYRNAHWIVLNNSKVAFKDIMDERYPDEYELFNGKVKTIYTIFGGTNHKFDLPNVCSIVQKYFEDWLVSKGIIKDDNVSIVINCEYRFGGVDKTNPRAEITIENMEE